MAKTKKVTAKSQGLPSVLFVYTEEDGDDIYFIANDSAKNVVDVNEDKIVGLYRFEKLVKIGAKTTIEDVK